MGNFFDKFKETPENQSFPSMAELTIAKKNIKSKNSSHNEEKDGQLTLDIYQGKNEIIIKSAIAGVTVNDIDISVTIDSVTIKGRREKDEKVKQSDYYFQELYWGAFSRKVILPEDIDPDKAKASMKNGLLTIRLPRLEKEKSKKLVLK